MKIKTSIIRYIEDDLPLDPHGQHSIGEAVDAIIRGHIEDEEQVRDLSLSFTDEEWQALIHFPKKLGKGTKPSRKATTRHSSNERS